MDEPLVAPPTARFKLTPGVGESTVILDGQNISNLLKRVTVDIKGGAFPAVFLELATQVPIDAIECDAVITVTQTVEQDPGIAVLEFFALLDPEELDREVLESFELGGPKSYGAAAFEVIKRWASR